MIGRECDLQSPRSSFVPFFTKFRFFLSVFVVFLTSLIVWQNLSPTSGPFSWMVRGIAQGYASQHNLYGFKVGDIEVYSKKIVLKNILIPRLPPDPYQPELERQDVKISHLEIQFHLSQLLHDRVLRSITLKGLQLQPFLTRENKLSFGPLDPLLFGSQTDFPQKIKCEEAKIFWVNGRKKRQFFLDGVIDIDPMSHCTAHFHLKQKDVFDLKGRLKAFLSNKEITFQIHMDTSQGTYPAIWKAVKTDLNGRYEPKSQDLQITMHSMLTRFRSKVCGALIEPLVLKASATGNLKKILLKGEISVLEKIKTLSPQPFISFEGHVNPLEEKGIVQISFPQKAVHSFWDLSPIFTPLLPEINKAQGVLSLKGQIMWDQQFQNWEGPLEIDFQNLTLTGGPVQVYGAQGHLYLTHFTPLKSKVHQWFKAKEIHVHKLSFQNIEAGFDLQPLKGIDIHQVTAQTMGGEITLNDFQFKPTLKIWSASAAYGNLQLSDLISFTDIENLWGEGRITGEAHFSYKNNQILLENAEMRATSDEGRLRYIVTDTLSDSLQPTPELKEGTKLALSILDDMYFTLLRVSIQKLKEGTDFSPQFQVLLHFLGSNPKVFEGYPFEFKIETQGALGDLLSNTLHALQSEAASQSSQAVKK